MQNKTVLAGIFSGVLLLIPAAATAQSPANPQSGTPQNSQRPSQSAPDGNNPNAPSPEKVDDKKFVKEAAIGGLTEIELGKLAAERGSSDAVKQFGQRLVDDHAKANSQLKDVATRAGFAVPDSLDSKQQSRVDKLAKLNGSEFDKAFIKEAVKDHESDVRAFEDESQNGSNALVKAFASGTLPTLQEHLTMAKDLRKNGGAMANSSR